MIYEEKETYNGFVLKTREFIKEIKSEGFYFIHEKTKARLIAIKNKDNNKTFSISFKTLSRDSTGVPHILEHSVLSGSRKYPLKDVFSEIAKGGLNTFLNAFTGLDSTMYPFSTRNEKEYFNIMDIYLDSVLNPLLSKNTFLREGWYFDIKDRNEPLKLNGIVYNEMKGAYSDPYELLSNNLAKALMPGSSYSYNTGGDPLEIPDLTYEQFVNYHHKYYHPSNSMIYVYGDTELGKELAFIDRFLSDFDYKDYNIEIEKGRLIQKPVYSEDSYSIDASSSTREKTFIEIGSIISDMSDLELSIAFSLLSNLLHKSNASPLKEEIIKARICNDFGGYFSTHFYNTVFLTILSGSERENRDSFMEIYRKTLEKLVKKGFDKSFTISEVNRFEFDLRERNSTSLRGLEYGYFLLHPCIHNFDNIFDFLKLSPILEKIKEKALNGRLLENLIDQYLLNNPRTAIITLVPDPEKASKINKKLEQRLEEIKLSLSPEDIDRHIKEAENLRKESGTNITDKELSIIPKLTISDIDKEIRFHKPAVGSVNEIPTIISDLYTNGIIYAELGFSADSLDENELHLLRLFGKVLTDLGTRTMSHEELSILKSNYTGNVSSYFDVFSEFDNPEKLKTYFWVKFSTTAGFVNKSIELMADILSGTTFDDENRIKDIIDKIFIRTEQEILSEGDEVPSLRLRAYLGEKGRLAESVYGYSAFDYLKDIRNNYADRKESLKASFLRIKEKLFNRKNLLINIICEENNASLFMDNIDTLLDSMDDKDFQYKKKNFKPLEANEAFLTPAEVVFAYAGANLYKTGLKYHGCLEVLSKYIARDYLYKHIRLIGGAYGSAFSIDSSTGDFLLGSYRDPNVKETYLAYNNLPDDLENFSAGDELFLQFIIGAYSSFDPLLNPDTRGILARNDLISGKSIAFKQKTVEEILSTKPEDIVALAPYIRESLRNSYKCIIGSSSKITANKEMFSRLISI